MGGRGGEKDGASREGNVSIDRLKDKLHYYSAVQFIWRGKHYVGFI